VGATTPHMMLLRQSASGDGGSGVSDDSADDVQDTPKPASGRRTGRALTNYEPSRVIGAAYDTNEKTAFVTVAMAQFGLRIGEALGLRRADFDL